MRRTLESYLIMLKEDFRISEISKSIYKSLTATLTDAEIFSPAWTASFLANSQGDFPITDRDPSPVATLKKALNSLNHVSKIFTELESIPIDRDRYTIGIGKDLVKKAYHGIDELYGAFHLVNHATIEVQNILGPSFESLIPVTTAAFNALQQFRPNWEQKTASRAMASLYHALPDSKPTNQDGHEKLSRMIHELPQFFRSIQGLLFNSQQSDRTENEPINAGKKIQEMKKLFDNVAQKNRFFGFPSFIKIAYRLFQDSAEIVNSTGPLTQEAYKFAIEKLNQIRHEVAPTLIAALERVETSFGLRAGLLTTPALQQIEQFYSHLVENSDILKQAAEMTQDTLPSYIDKGLVGFIRRRVSPTRLAASQATENVPDIAVLQDVQYQEKLNEERLVKLTEYQSQQEDSSKVKAAESFFEKISAYSATFQARCKWSVANLSPEDKEFLAEQYQIFQAEFAKNFPEIDQLLVDALTHVNEGSFLNRIKNSDYKQLWSKNHFTKILNCKDTVLSNIHQARAYTEQMAQKTQMLFDEQPSTLNLPTYPIALQQKVPVFSFYDAPDPHHQDIENLKESETQLLRQQFKLQNAHHALQAFMEYCQVNFTEDDPQLNRLSSKDRQHLSFYYQKFQSLVEYHNPELNLLLTNALTSDTKKASPLYLSQIAQPLENLGDAIDTDIAVTEESRQTCHERIQDTNQMAQAKQPLEPMGDTIAAQTLLGNIAQLNLSEKIERYTDKFEMFLQENIEPDIVEQLNLKETTLPYKNLHHENSAVRFYKNLLNAMDKLKKTFSEIETLNQNASNKLSRSYFFYQLGTALGNLVDAKYELENALHYSGVNTILQEGLELLEPLKNIPLIGPHIANILPPVQNAALPVDMIEAWQAQQNIVKRAVSPTREPNQSETSTSQPVAPPENTRATTEDPKGYLEQFANALFRIPQKLKQLNALAPSDDVDETEVTQQIKTFVEYFNQLSYGPGTLKKILNAANAINAQLSETGIETRQLILNIRNIVGQLVIPLTDNVEFELAFKPGHVSTPVFEQINQFYQTMLSYIAVQSEEESDHLNYILDNQLVYQRLQNEENHLEQLKKNISASESAAEIFGTEEDHGILTNLKNTFAILKEQKDYDIQKDTLSEEKGLLFEVFFESYQKLQPHLEQIDPAYNTHSFLREIQTKADCQSAIQNILKLEDELHKIIDVETNEKQERVDRCKRRISYLKNQINHEEALKKEHLDSYKQSLFETFIDTKLHEMIQNEIKALPILPRAVLISAKQHLLAQQNTVLHALDANQNIHLSIKNLIKKQLDSHLTESSHIISKCHAIMNNLHQIQAESFGEEDLPIRYYLETQKTFFQNAQTLEELNEIDDQLQDMLDYLKNNPAIQAVKKAISSLRESTGALSRNKEGKASLIESMMAKVPLEDRADIYKQNTSETKAVIDAIASRRSIGTLHAPRRNTKGEIIEKGRVFQQFKKQAQTSSETSTTHIKTQLRKIKERQEKESEKKDSEEGESDSEGPINHA